MRRSFSSILMSNSSASGSTATVAAEVWMRPEPSVAGTRCTRCTPDSNFSRANTPRAADRGDRLLVAADAGVGELHDLELPAVLGGVALVHAEQVGGEQRRLLAAGAGADFEDGVLLVGRVLGQQHALHGLLELGQALLERRRPLPPPSPSCRDRPASASVSFSSLLGLAPFVDRLDQRPEVGILLGGRDELLQSRLPPDSAACSSAWRATTWSSFCNRDIG